MKRTLAIIAILSLLGFFPRGNAASSQELESLVGNWRGDYLINAPARKVRAAVIPLPEGEALSPLGACINCAPVMTQRLVLLFPPAPGADPDESRIIIPLPASIRTENGPLPLDTEAERLLKDESLFCQGELDDSEQKMLSMLLLAFQMKLKTYSALPLFVGASTSPARLEETIAALLQDRNTFLISFLPKGAPLPTPESSTGTPMGRAASRNGLKGIVSSLGVTKNRKTRETESALLFQESAILESRLNEAGAPAFLNDFEGRILLRLAKEVIISSLTGSESPIVPSFAANLATPYGCQLTLRKKGADVDTLQTLPGQKPLTTSLILSAYKFAKDEKYSLKKEDIPDISLKLEVLGLTRKLTFSSLEELYSMLRPGRHGVFLTLNGKTRGFLPAVWQQTPTPQQFIQALCARLEADPKQLLSPEATLLVFETVTFTE